MKSVQSTRFPQQGWGIAEHGGHAVQARERVMSHRDGLALRSLVYHEILSAYLNYVKARGYTSMFIWACPPMAVSLSMRAVSTRSTSYSPVHGLKYPTLPHSNLSINTLRELSCTPVQLMRSLASISPNSSEVNATLCVAHWV